MLHYTIYLTKNLINDKIYIGKHKTSDLNDDYLGSGKRLLNAIKKHGIEHFTKEILHVFDNESDMNSKERELVTEEFCKRPDTYNIKIGGEGGWDHINGEFQDFYIQKAQETMHQWSEERRISINEKKKNIGYDNGMFGRDRSGQNNPRFGVRLSEETKSKISKSQTGKKHSVATKQKMSMNSSRHNKGKIMSEEQKKIISEKVKQLPKIECPHCKNGYSIGMYSRWHGNKCRKK